jgi:hypothetical protein
MPKTFSELNLPSIGAVASGYSMLAAVADTARIFWRPMVPRLSLASTYPSDAINEATQTYRRENLHFQIRDLESIDDAELRGKFDVIVNFETLPHLADPDKFVRGIKSHWWRAAFMSSARPTASWSKPMNVASRCIGINTRPIRQASSHHFYPLILPRFHCTVTGLPIKVSCENCGTVSYFRNSARRITTPVHASGVCLSEHLAKDVKGLPPSARRPTPMAEIMQSRRWRLERLVGHRRL